MFVDQSSNGNPIPEQDLKTYNAMVKAGNDFAKLYDNKTIEEYMELVTQMRNVSHFPLCVHDSQRSALSVHTGPVSSVQTTHEASSRASVCEFEQFKS